jgi:mRNA-degrading endonuclease RelE of RelBE toxin-antitoxin system
MPTAQRDGDSVGSPEVLISNTAINMISSLHHADNERVEKTIQQLTFMVKDQSKAEPLKGLENAYVVRSGDLRVIFKREGARLVIESVVKRG